MSELSLVIRTFNCRELLRECLSRLAGQTFKDVEVIVVDSGSADGTVEAARAAGARVVEVPPGTFTYGGTLNLGFREARGRLLGALSAHAMLMEPAALERLVDELRNGGPSVAGAYGCPFFSDAEAMAPPGGAPAERIVQGDLARKCNLGLSNSFSVIRRELWEAYPFPEERCEDQKWAAHHLARGLATVRVRSARYRYRLNRSLGYYVRKHRDDLLMLHQTWPQGPWPLEELRASSRNRYRLWCAVRRLRKNRWNWTGLDDLQKWLISEDLGVFWAGCRLRRGRLWWLAGASDLARAFLLPKARKGWLLPGGGDS